MVRLLILLASLVGTSVLGCAAPETTLEMDAMQKPETLHAYFVEQIRAGEFSNAHKCLSFDAQKRLQYEPFYFIVQHELVQRLLTGFEQVGVNHEAGTVRWRNREFGIERDYRLVAQKRRSGMVYGYDFTEEQLNELKDSAMAWFRAQKRAADNRMYTYPPDWHYTPLP